MNTYILTKHIKLTNLIKLNYLQILIDWITNTKLLSTKPFYLFHTLLFSFLSLFFSSTNFVFILSLYNNSFSPFFWFQILDFSYFKPILFLISFKLNQLVIKTNSSYIENIFTLAQFQALYIMPMLYFGTLNKLFFKKTNIIKFVKTNTNFPYIVNIFILA